MKKYLTSDKKWWVLVDDGFATIGLTREALHNYGELLVIHSARRRPFIATPGVPIAAIEGVNELGCLTSPIGGRVRDFTQWAEDDPSSITEDTALFSYDNIDLPATLVSVDSDALPRV